MKYSELFFISSFSQSNIYNFTIFSNENDENFDVKKISNSLLIFYLKPAIPNESIIKQHCDLISIGSNNDSIHAVTKPLEFPELSVTTEVVSIDSYIDYDADILSIVLCLIKKENKPKSMMHIYEVNLKSGINFEKMDKFKPNLVFKKDIGFYPLHVTHTKYWNFTSEKLGLAFVISISDECLSHSQKDKSSPFILAFTKQSYQEQTENDSQPSLLSRPGVSSDTDHLDFSKDKKTPRRYIEKNARKRTDLDDSEIRIDESMPIQKKYHECHNNNFIEFTSIKQKILFMEFMINLENYQRISCFGSDCGKFWFSIVSMKKPEIVVYFTSEHNSPITSLHLINDSQFKEMAGVRDCETSASIKRNDYHVLVCSAVEQSVIYKNVVKSSGFSQRNQFCLGNSDQYDCILSSTLADIDMDGEHEILLGTFQQYVLIYKWQISENDINGYFRLISKIKCAGAVHAIMHIDLTRDGIKELLVLTTRGLHIYQLLSEYVQNILEQRLICNK